MTGKRFLRGVAGDLAWLIVFAAMAAAMAVLSVRAIDAEVAVRQEKMRAAAAMAEQVQAWGRARILTGEEP